MQSCPKLCSIEDYKPGQMNAIKWIESCRNCGVDILTITEKGLNGAVSLFVRTLTSHLTFIAAYVYMPYLLLCNLSKMNAANILSICFCIPVIIRFSCTLTLALKLKRLRFHFYVYGLYLKVIIFLGLQYLLLPLCSGFAINAAVWLLLKQSMPKLVLTQIAWQCVKCYVTGFLFNNYLEQNLRVISSYLEKSYNYLQCDAVLALARREFAKQLQRELRRVGVLTVAVLALVWLPVYILPKYDQRQQQTLQCMYAFFWIRAGFKRFLNVSHTKKRLLHACCMIMQQTKADCRKKLLWIVCGCSVLVSAFCLQLCCIHLLGWYISTAYNGNNTYCYVYGTCMYYLLQLLIQLLRGFKWQHFRQLILVVCVFPCTLPLLLLISELIRLPFVKVEDYRNLKLGVISFVTFLSLGYVLRHARHGWFMRYMRYIWRQELADFTLKLILASIQALLFYISAGSYKFAVLVTWKYLDILYYINYLLIRKDLERISATMKELMNPYAYEFTLQNYNKNEDKKSLLERVMFKIKSQFKYVLNYLINPF